MNKKEETNKYETKTYNIKKNDYVIDKGLHTLFFVVKRDLFNVLLRREKDDAMMKFPMHHVNAHFSRIDYDTAMLLYGNENKEIAMEERKDEEFEKMDSSI